MVEGSIAVDNVVIVDSLFQAVHATGAMAGTGNREFTMVNGHHLTEDSMAELQQPTLKARGH
eukprot:5731680-Amphidinium_carterae.2